MIGSTDKSTERQECFEKPAGRPRPETSLKLAHFPGGSGHYDGCFIVLLGIICESLHRNQAQDEHVCACLLTAASQQRGKSPSVIE